MRGGQQLYWPAVNNPSRTYDERKRPADRPSLPPQPACPEPDLLGHDPACLEIVVEIDESALELIEARHDYETDVLSSE